MSDPSLSIRNSVYNKFGTVDLEYLHPIYGWIATTVSPTDPEPVGRSLYDLAIAGTVEPYEPPTAEELRAGLPTLTARQLRLGLITNGIMPSQVQSAIEAMPPGADREKALVEWEYASSFDRLHPLIATVGAALGLTDAQVDAMWTAAASL